MSASSMRASAHPACPSLPASRVRTRYHSSYCLGFSGRGEGGGTLAVGRGDPGPAEIGFALGAADRAELPGSAVWCAGGSLSIVEAPSSPIFWPEAPAGAGGPTG